MRGRFPDSFWPCGDFCRCCRPELHTAPIKRCFLYFLILYASTHCDSTMISADFARDLAKERIAICVPGDMIRGNSTPRYGNGIQADLLFLLQARLLERHQCLVVRNPLAVKGFRHPPPSVGSRLGLLRLVSPSGVGLRQSTLRTSRGDPTPSPRRFRPPPPSGPASPAHRFSSSATDFRGAPVLVPFSRPPPNKVPG